MAPGKNHVTAISTEIFKYVRIHPNFASRPVWCEKMFLCCFSLKVGRKDLTNRPKVLSSHPHPTVFCRVARGFSYLVYPNSAFFKRKGAMGGGGGGVVERELQACLSSLFFLLLGRNNTGTSFQITQVGSRSLGGFWHTWKFQSKSRLRGSCPESFKCMDICHKLYWPHHCDHHVWLRH